MKETVEASLRTLVPVKFRPRLRATYERLSCLGFRYKCPFCNSRLRRFLPSGLSFPVLEEREVVGGRWRPNARCPTCDSSDRERLLYLYLLHKTDIFEKPQKVLHVAPEANVTKMLRVNATVDYLTADMSSKSVLVQMDITDIQFADDAFDAIICNHVLEHVVDDRKAMSELYRTLKPGGWAILQVPVSLTLSETYEDLSITTTAGREEAFGQGDHVRIYAKDYQDRLEQAGFKVNVFKWITDAENFGGRQNIFGLDEEECVYFVSKHL